MEKEFAKGLFNIPIGNRYRHRFFDQVGYETMFASSGNKDFYLDNVTVRRTKIMNNVLDHLKILIFKVIF